MYTIPEEAEPKSSTNNPRMACELETERLLLRRIQANDAVSYHEVLSNHDATKHMVQAPHTDISQTIARISTLDDPASDEFAICIKPSNFTLSPQLIGTIGTHGEKIRYILHPSYWGKGIASEAMEAFLENVWKTRREEEFLTANVDPRNTGSLVLLEKHGFFETGREKGTYTTHIGLCDSVYLRLERPKEKIL